jgi:uncharacterized protein (UPF0371 family)
MDEPAMKPPAAPPTSAALLTPTASLTIAALRTIRKKKQEVQALQPTPPGVEEQVKVKLEPLESEEEVEDDDEANVKPVIKKEEDVEVEVAMHDVPELRQIHCLTITWTVRC